jgi:hypothetical protein
MARSTPIQVGLTATLMAASILAVLLLSGAVKPVELLSPALHGQGSAVIKEDFDTSGVRKEDPFDGQYIYVTARLLPDLDAISDQIYEADYRLVRILHPLLASPAPAGTATVIALGLWSLVGVFLFGASFADLLGRHGHDPGWALAATLVACSIPLLMTTSEALAFGLGMAGLALADRGRFAWALVPLALAGLTRESALTFAAAAAILAWTQRRRGGWAIAIVPLALAPTALWWAYVQSITPSSRVPLEPLGILHMGDQVGSDIVAAVISLVLIGVSLVTWRDVPALRWLAIVFAAWIPLYESFAFKLLGLPRLSAPSIALAIAGILRWRRERRSATGAALVGREHAIEPAG